MQNVVASLLFGLVSGSCDASSYLLLQKLLTANITGDLLLLGVDLGGRYHRQELGRVLAIPVFFTFTWAGRWAAGALQRRGVPPLRLLLLATVGLLAGFMVLALSAGPFVAQDAPNTLIVGMLGVIAMALLNVVARMWPALAASTTAMTGNSVKLLMDLAELTLGAREREPELLRDTGRLGVTVAAFVAGCGLAALVYAAAGPWCTALPLGFAACVALLCPKQPG